MFEPDPGPLARIDPASLRPFPTRPSFEGIVAGALDGLGGLDSVLVGARIATTENPSVDLDGVFLSTIGAAGGEVDAQLRDAPESPLATYVANGDNEDTIRSGVLRWLPPADADVEPNYDPPPGS